MAGILLFCVPLLLTVAVTAALCRFRLRRKKRVSYGTMFAGAIIVGLVMVIIMSEGNCFSPNYWSHGYHHDAQHKWDPDWPRSMVRLIGFMITISMLPALAVVAYYQKRLARKRD